MRFIVPTGTDTAEVDYFVMRAALSRDEYQSLETQCEMQADRATSPTDKIELKRRAETWRRLAAARSTDETQERQFSSPIDRLRRPRTR